MANIIRLPTHTDQRGSLTVLEKELPFAVKRVYYIYDVKGQRGGHAHKITQQALICIYGSCNVVIKNGLNHKNFTLDSAQKCLLLEPNDWHTMQNFSDGAILLVLASHEYDIDDYLFDIPQ